MKTQLKRIIKKHSTYIIFESMVITNAIKECSDKVKQKKLNKIMHATNGNRQNDKNYNHYILMNINKGSSDF